MSPRSYIFLLLLWFCQRRRRQKLKAFLLRSHQALLLCSCSSSPVLILLHLLVFLAFLYFPGIRSYREKNFFGEFFPNLECFFFFNYHLPPCSFILYRGGGAATRLESLESVFPLSGTVVWKHNRNYTLITVAGLEIKSIITYLLKVVECDTKLVYTCTYGSMTKIVNFPQSLWCCRWYPWTHPF